MHAMAHCPSPLPLYTHIATQKTKTKYNRAKSQWASAMHACHGTLPITTPLIYTHCHSEDKNKVQQSKVTVGLCHACMPWHTAHHHSPYIHTLPLRRQKQSTTEQSHSGPLPCMHAMAHCPSPLPLSTHIATQK